MKILSSKNPDTIRKKLWSNYLSKIENVQMRESLEAVGELYLASYKDGEKAFGYDKSSEEVLFAQREKKVQQILQLDGLTEAEKIKLLDSVGVMHVLFNMSNLKAAFNAGKMQEIVDNMVDEVVRDLPDLPAVLDHFNQVVVDRVLTAHPTFVGRLEYAKLLRDLEVAINAEDDELVDAVLAKLAAPEFAAVVDKNLTVADETNFMIHYLSGACDDLPQLYEMFDKSLARKSFAYDPYQLDLKINFGDWGSSGDKDGNKMVTAYSLAKGIPLRRAAIADWHLKNLEGFSGKRVDDVRERLERLKTFDAAKNYATAIGKIKFDLEEIYQEVYYASAQPSQQKQAALNGHRALKHFGLSLGYIEMRETADEFQHVISRFMTAEDAKQLIGVEAKYSELSAKDKESFVNALLEPKNQELVKTRIAEALKAIPDEAKKPDYKYKDTGVTNNAIFYNTINRLLVAKANPDVFPGQQVLAEATSPQQLKEMLLLLKATGTEKQLLAIPLFEEPEILINIGDLLETMLKDPVYYNYLVEYSLQKFEKEGEFKLPEKLKEEIAALSTADARFEVKKEIADQKILELTGGRYGLSSVLDFQIQLAHSDNTRRGGTTAARSAIGDSHRIASETARKFGFGVRFHEGGSETDSMRKGGRDLRAQMNVYDSHDATGHKFVKGTVQGMDMIQVMNGPLHLVSYIGEILCHGLKSTERWDGEKFVTPQKKIEANFAAAASPIQRVVNVANAQLDHYLKTHFAHPRLAEAMDQIFDYSGCKEAGTVGSRAGERVEAAPGTKAGKAVATDATKVRTIGYSEAGQHSYCHFGFIGAGRFREELLKSLKATVEELVAKRMAFTEHNQVGLSASEAFDLAALTESGAKINAELVSKMSGDELLELDAAIESSTIKPDHKILNDLYKTSPLFRDIVDRNANAVAASTDFDKVWANAMAKPLHVVTPGTGKVAGTFTIAYRPQPSELESYIKNHAGTTLGYLAGLELDCRKASQLAIEAITGKEFELSDDLSTIDLKLKVRDLMKSKGMLYASDVIMSVADTVRASVPEDSRSHVFNTAHHHAKDLATLHAPRQQVIDLQRNGIAI